MAQVASRDREAFAMGTHAVVQSAAETMPSLPPGISSHLLELIDAQLAAQEVAAAERLAHLVPASLASEAPVAERRAAIALRRGDLAAAGEAISAATRPTARLHLFESIVALRRGQLDRARAASAVASDAPAAPIEAIALDAILSCLGDCDATPLLGRDPRPVFRERIAAADLAAEISARASALRQLVGLLGGPRQAGPRCGAACLVASAVEELLEAIEAAPPAYRCAA